MRFPCASGPEPTWAWCNGNKTLNERKRRPDRTGITPHNTRPAPTSGRRQTVFRWLQDRERRTKSSEDDSFVVSVSSPDLPRFESLLYIPRCTSTPSKPMSSYSGVSAQRCDQGGCPTDRSSNWRRWSKSLVARTVSERLKLPDLVGPLFPCRMSPSLPVARSVSWIGEGMPPLSAWGLSNDSGSACCRCTRFKRTMGPMRRWPRNLPSIAVFARTNANDRRVAWLNQFR